MLSAGGPEVSPTSSPEFNDIPFMSFREWPLNVAKAERWAGELSVLPVHITEAPRSVELFQM